MNTITSHPRWDSASADELRDWQLARLRRYLREVVVPFCPHYRDLATDHGLHPDLIAGPEDLEQIPFTRKRDLTADAEAPRKFVIQPDPAALKRRPSTVLTALLRGRRHAADRLAHEFRPVMMTSTTGRSSDPVPFLYTKHDLDLLTLAGRRVMQLGRSKPEYRHFNAFPYAPHLAFWQAHYASIGFTTFCLSSGGGKVMGTEGNLRLINKVQPEVIIGMPTFLYHMMREAIDQGLQLPRLKMLVLGGEKAPQGLRRKLRELAAGLGAERVFVLSTYGFTEAKMAWLECRPPEPGSPSSGYHLSPDLGIVEVIDPETGRLVDEHQPGEIVYTQLDARGSTVLRYRTGDLIEGGLTWQPCPWCGRTGPRLLGRISRVSDIHRLQLDKVKGTLVDLNQLEHVLDEVPGLAAWQLELRKVDDDPMERDQIIIHACGEAGNGGDHLRDVINSRMRQATELSANGIAFHTLEEMRDRLGVGRLLKEEKIVDHRPGHGPGLPDQTADKTADGRTTPQPETLGMSS